MACAKSVKDCPDRLYSNKNAAKTATKPLTPSTALIGTKKYTIIPKSR